MAAHGLLRTAAERHRYVSWALPDLIGYAFPTARGADLDLLVDVLGWFTAIDDHFDGPPGRSPTAAAAIVTPLIIHTATPQTMVSNDSDGFVDLSGAWRDLWRRQSHNAPQPWRARAAKDWESCLRTFVEEATHRHDHTVPTVAEAVLLRRHASCLYPFMNLLERVTGTELPDDDAFEHLRATTADVAAYLNDLYSLEREEGQGEIHNMVLILRRRHNLGRDEAIRAVRGRVHRLLRERDQLAGHLARAHPAAHRYLEGMRAIVDGVHLWTSGTRRYQAHGEG
jgi:Terpene synthase family 2, C-terminal metal binding